MDNAKYFVCIDGKSFPVSGTTVAWDAYDKAEQFGNLTGSRVWLVDGETGEILLDSWDEE